MTLTSKERAILFADVSGSTALYELLGDKPAAKTIEACLEELRKIVSPRPKHPATCRPRVLKFAFFPGS
jgi:class 3 adenylate cyclase